MYERILVVLDGSKDSESVLGRAAVLAARHNAEVDLLMVQPVPMMVIDDGRVIATIDQEVERMRATVQPYLAKWKARFEDGGLKTSASVRFGETAEQIAEHVKSHDIDLIVVPTKAQKGLDRLLRRGVADKIVRAVPTPVLLMKAA